MVLLCVSLSAILFCTRASAEIRLAAGGQTAYAVVTPETPTPIEAAAAREPV